MTTIVEYMNEEKKVNRWLILRVGLIGGLAGAILAFIFFLSGIIG